MEGAISAISSVKCLGRFAALLRLTREHLNNLGLAQRLRFFARDLFISNRSECKTDRRHDNLILRTHRFSEVVL